MAHINTRQRYLEYAQSPFYRTLGMKLGITPQQAVKRSKRRARAVMKVAGQNSKTYRYIGAMRLDNPFIEAHAWKFLVREALRNACPRQKNKN